MMVLLACSSSLFAQEVDSYGIPVNSLNVQVSDAILPTAFGGIMVGLGTAIGASLAAVFTGGQATIDAPKVKGVTPFFSAGYEYHFPDTRWSLGPEAGYYHFGVISNDSYQHLNFTTVVATGKFYYKPAGICKLYGGLSLGAGALFTTVSNIKTPPASAEDSTGAESTGDSGSSSSAPSLIPTIQFNPIGMRLGSEKVAFIAELGVGYKGFLSLGANIAL